MTSGVVRHGYVYSVYGWIARMVLYAKGVNYGWVEGDPFAGGLAGLHPFGRVPVLVHGGLRFMRRRRLAAMGISALTGRL